MRNLLILILLLSLTACNAVKTKKSPSPVKVFIDLTKVEDDKLLITIDPGRITSERTNFYLPKIVPGHYNIIDLGRFAEDFKAYDYLGNELPVEKRDKSTWRISDAKKLDKVSYLVNDTYDMKDEGGTFSPEGTNIKPGENFMLNLHAFVGYFKGQRESDYELQIKRPKNLIPGTALSPKTTEISETMMEDIYKLDRYFQVTDNPIMYAKPDTSRIHLNDIEVLLSVHSPTNLTSAKKLRPGIERTIRAQKNFLGDIDNTSKYAVLLYLSEEGKPDAKGMGALEHHSSTVVNLPENIPATTLDRIMTDVVSHEFFHILTPLNVHSEEIHYFDYNKPDMSRHLWMYEGVTEYFAQLFQVNQALIDEDEFYKRIQGKIRSSKQFDDNMPFTEMSENILEDKYQDNYLNVYQKGALIGMALDIRLRELSNGEKGLLSLMKELSTKYGKDQPFKDKKLIDDIVEITYPEIEDFFNRYVTGTSSIPYDEFFAKVGLEFEHSYIESGPFNRLSPDDNPNDFIFVSNGKLLFNDKISDNSFLKGLGVRTGDKLLSVNGKSYDAENLQELIKTSEGWAAGTEVLVSIERKGEKIDLKDKIGKTTRKISALKKLDLAETDKRVKLRNKWLKG